MAYIDRRADLLLAELLSDAPAVLISGPRAVGKTTSAIRAAETVVRLDRAADAGAFRADPDAALKGLREPILLDEWQEVPDVLGAVKRAVDDDPHPGRFLLTGSVRGDTEQATWPGTGRLIHLKMHGLTIAESRGRISGPTLVERLAAGDSPNEAPEDLDIRDYIDLALRGGFPEIAAATGSSRTRRAWLSSYVNQIVTRDALAVEERDPTRLRRFFEAFALNTAGVVADTTIAESAQMDRRTAAAYERLLRNLLVVDAFPAWRTNRLKRLTVASKRYLVDPSLLVGLLGVDTESVLRDGDLLGRALDTFVAAQLRADAAMSDAHVRLHHLREQRGDHEIDLIAEVGAREVIAFEVKATSAPVAGDARHLAWLARQIGERFLAGVLFHTGPRTFQLADRLWAAPISALWA